MTIGAPTYFPTGPIEIRDATTALLKAMGGFRRVFPFRTLPTDEDYLPAACVYHAGDRTEPWGDANVGAPSFMHTLTLVVDIVTTAASEVALDGVTIPLVEIVKATLLTDPSWVGLVEAIERCDTRYTYPKEGETFLCVGTVEFEVSFKSEWAPVVEHDFRTMAVQVGADPKTAFVQTITLPGADT